MYKSKYGLPNKVLFCKKCVISNQRPSSEVELKHNKKTKKATIFLIKIRYALLVSNQKSRKKLIGKKEKKSITGTFG